jgi:hypothetical protein
VNLTPLQSRLSPWSEEPTSSRGIRRSTRSRVDHRSAPPSTCLPSVHSRGCRHRASDPSSRLESRSVLVVSHHLDGFLRSGDCGLVASRCRSWGSPRFPHLAAIFTAEAMGWIDPHVPRRRRSYPPKDSTRLQPYRVTAAVAFLPFFLCSSRASVRTRCRARISSRSPRRPSTSRRFSTCESVTSSHRCQWYDALSSLGFVPLQGPPGCVSSERIAAPSRRCPLRDPHCSSSVAHPSISDLDELDHEGRGYRNSRERFGIWSITPQAVDAEPARTTEIVRWVSNRAPASRCSVPIRSTSLP